MRRYDLPSCFTAVTLVGALLLSTPSLILAQAPETASEPAAADVTVGKKLYNSVGCWSCHGYSGQGANSKGIASGPRINARVLPKFAFLQQLRSPMNVMPPYTQKVLSDEQAGQIFEYLRSLPVPDEGRQIALLK